MILCTVYAVEWLKFSSSMTDLEAICCSRVKNRATVTYDCLKLWTLSSLEAGQRLRAWLSVYVCRTKVSFFKFHFTEEERPTTVSAAAHLSSVQTSVTSSPFGQPFQTGPTPHLLAQPYPNESSSFGPIYHAHSSLTHAAYANPYDKYKLSPPAHTASAYSPAAYQGFYATTHHHQMIRPNGCVDYVPR